MLIKFLVASTFLGLFISYIWSSTGLHNVLIKVIFSGYTFWSALMLAAAVWPFINNGTVKLF